MSWRNHQSAALACSILACSGAIAFGQIPAKDADAKSRVARMLEVPLAQAPEQGAFGLSVAARDVLFAARTYGGVVDLDGCADRRYPITYRNNDQPVTLKGALDAIIAGTAGYKWSLSDNGAINILPTGPLPQFLQTEISYFDWDVNAPMFTALAGLSDNIDVRTRRLDLNITQFFHGGLYALPIERPVEKPKEWRRVEHVSLFSALNAIAQSYGTGVWVYSECRRDDSLVIQLATLVN